MPIIPAPAHHMDTIHTVLVRCQAITKKLGQADVVITFDEALYCRAKELVWHKPDQFANVIVRLGGFHSAQNYLRAIGQHCTDCGLSDAWVESGVYGECTADRILEGKCWNRAIRAHKLTMEALWRLMWNEFKKWKTALGEGVNPSLMEKSVNVAESFANHDLATIRSSVSDCFSVIENSMGDFHEFILSRSQDGTFVFWKQYVDMVSHLLCFIIAERDGHWGLHLESFKEMLSLMAIYDHVNFTRWGTVYAPDMDKLQHTAPMVYAEFSDGNFVIKGSDQRFIQVSTALALEYVNQMCNVSGGLSSITRTKTALDRWMLTCTDRARLSQDVRDLMGLTKINESHHKELNPSRMRRYECDVSKLMHQMQQFDPFGREEQQLICISSINDVAPDTVRQDTLTAAVRAKQVLIHFIDQRLVTDAQISLYDPIKKNKSLTFSPMRTISVKTPSGPRIIKSDKKAIPAFAFSGQRWQGH